MSGIRQEHRRTVLRLVVTVAFVGVFHAAESATAQVPATSSLGGWDGELSMGAVSVVHAARAATVWTSRTPRLDVGARLARMRLVQESTAWQFTEASVWSDSLPIGGAWRLSAGASAWFESIRPTNVGGYLSGVRAFGGERQLSAHLSREPIWRPVRGADPLAGLRVRDLRRLDRGFAATDVRVTAQFGNHAGPLLQVEAGGTHLNGGNRRGLVWARLELPVVTSRTLEVRVRPTGYAESFSGTTPGFLTPRLHASLGMDLGLTARHGQIEVSGSMSPQFFRYASTSGVGMGGALSATQRFGPALARVSANFLRHSQYRFVQIETGFGVPLR